MIYKFRSKAASDLIMMGPDGDRVLRLIGREPAAKGIIEPASMPAARQALEAAVADAQAAGADQAGDDEQAGRAAKVGLKQRVWPMLRMLERAEAAGEPIVWGV